MDGRKKVLSPPCRSKALKELLPWQTLHLNQEVWRSLSAGCVLVAKILALTVLRATLLVVHVGLTHFFQI